MAWLELSVEVGQEKVDLVSEKFVRAGYNGGVIIEETDQSGPTSPAGQSDPKISYIVRIYIRREAECNALVARLDQAVRLLQADNDVGDMYIHAFDDDQDDMDRVWKAHYACRDYNRVQRVGRHFVITPFWEWFEPQPDDRILRLDPQLGFGTGLHPTTRICLELLEQYATPAMEALDFGSGSGILSIALAQCGARVVALDNDLGAVESSRRNIALNSLQERVTVRQGSLGEGANLGHWLGWKAPIARQRIEAEGTFDLIVSNALARIHIAVASDYRRALRARGLLITSGIIAHYAERVAAELLEAGFELIERHTAGSWVAFVHRTKQPQ